MEPADVERAFHEYGVNTFLVHWMMPHIIEGVRALTRQGLRDRLVLITEAGSPFPGSVRRGWQKTAHLLGDTCIDVLLYGWVRSRWALRPPVWEDMKRMKEEGKTRAIGFSAHDRGLAAELGRDLQPDVMMIRYNAAHRGAEQDVFATFDGNRPGFISYTATRWGMLLEPLPEKGFAKGMTAGECYRFALMNPSVDVTLFAPTTAEQMRLDLLEVKEGPLTDERHREIMRFGDAVHASAKGGRRWMFR
jgi:aryl-alcohol dehydrogenase-like predicted oxidoreductase